MLVQTLAYARSNAPRFVQELSDFATIASISADATHHTEIRRAAEWLRGDLDRIGFNVRLIDTPGNPLVFAEWQHPDPTRPTVLIYGHYDVQPADPLDLWLSEPFTPTIRDGFLYARGVNDNKAQHLAHIKACESLLAATGSLPCSVKFLIEGEEEIGGPNLPAAIHEHAALLACDVVVISDGELISLHQPAIVYGLRGLTYFEVTLRTAAHDLHSGSYGGNVQNPIMALAQILAQLKNERGSVTVPHFYDDVRILPLDERVALARVPIDEATIKHETGAPGAFGEPSFSVIERMGARPTLEIHGMWGGYVEPGQKTVIPCEAHAKISCRLVPHQDPHKIFELVRGHMRRLAPPHCELSFRTFPGSGNPSLVARDAPQFRAVERAAKATYGADPIYVLEGGSIPVVGDFQIELGRPIILLGLALPGDNLHAPNERMSLEAFTKGIEVSIRILAELAAAE